MSKPRPQDAKHSNNDVHLDRYNDSQSDSDAANWNTRVATLESKVDSKFDSLDDKFDSLEKMIRQLVEGNRPPARE